MSLLPCVLQPEFENIPQDLRQLPQWVVWREVDRGGKPTKAPFSATTGRTAAADNPSTWSTFEVAAAAYQQGGCAGIGFMFSGSDGFCGIDLDHCRNPETGELTGWAAEFIRQLDSYAEISPSGTGVKLILRATMPGKKRKRFIKKAIGGTVEIYDRSCYFTVTGHHLDGAPLIVQPRQAALNTLYPEQFCAKDKQSPIASPASPTGPRQPSPDPRGQGGVDEG